MRRTRLPLAILVGGLLVAACTSGAGGAPGGGYGAAPASTARSSAGPSVAVAPPSAAAGGGYGGGKGDYGTGSASPAAVASTVPGTVRLSGFAFEPTEMTVAAGTSLTFANDDGVAHDIVEGTDGTPVASPAIHVKLAPGATSSVTLATAGKIVLTCTIHPTMTMTLTVTP